MEYLWVGVFLWVQTITAGELPMLDNKSHDTPSSSYEIGLVDHATLSLQKAMYFESKLNETSFYAGFLEKTENVPVSALTLVLIGVCWDR